MLCGGTRGCGSRARLQRDSPHGFRLLAQGQISTNAERRQAVAGVHPGRRLELARRGVL